MWDCILYCLFLFIASFCWLILVCNPVSEPGLCLSCPVLSLSGLSVKVRVQPHKTREGARTLMWPAFHAVFLTTPMAGGRPGVTPPFCRNHPGGFADPHGFSVVPGKAFAAAPPLLPVVPSLSNVSPSRRPVESPLLLLRTAPLNHPCFAAFFVPVRLLVSSLAFRHVLPSADLSPRALLPLHCSVTHLELDIEHILRFAVFSHSSTSASPSALTPLLRLLLSVTDDICVPKPTVVFLALFNQPRDNV